MSKKIETGTATRAVFNTKFAAIATTVGSAVGLGNIWRFPYEAGENGGGAFIFCYLVFSLLIGVPCLVAEFVMGHTSRRNVIGAYRYLSPSKKQPWYLVGFLGVIAATLILGFYSVVAGWTFEYIFESVKSFFSGGMNEAKMEEQFSNLTLGWRPLIWTTLFSICNYLVLVRGVTKGIEKMCNVMMPVLFILLLILLVNSALMDNFMDGVRFMFHPDFSAITPAVMLSALGQAFFSLSLGVGCMITYSSYFSDNTRLTRTAMITMLLDSSVAILSGMIIFPAVFTYGMNVEAGPTLVFEVLPVIFCRMAAGSIWSLIFFSLLFVASLTSTVSLSEIVIAYLTEDRKMKRVKATTIASLIIYSLAVICTLSLGPCKNISIAGSSMFDIFDYIASNIMMPVGGMFCCLFVGWFMDKKILVNQLSEGGSHNTWTKPMIFMLKYVCPLAIFLIFLDSIGII